MEREENMRTHFTSFREISRLHVVFINIRSKQSVIRTQTPMNTFKFCLSVYITQLQHDLLIMQRNIPEL